MHHHSTLRDLTGQSFDRLTVLSFAGYRKHYPYWTCQCVCGTIKDILHYNLVGRRPTRSCGCLNRERAKKQLLVHGKSKTREYRIWGAMIRRCESPKNGSYFKYGERGITVCAGWHDFITFYTDMGPSPTPQHSLERLDNDGPYSPENCIWGTPQIQARNTRRNVFLTYNNITQCAEDWARLRGMDAQVIRYRKRVGWSDSDAITIPVTHRNRLLGLSSSRINRIT